MRRAVLMMILGAALVALAGCSDDAPEGEPVECGGGGQGLTVGGESYCVYDRAVVVENGFACPAGLDTLTTFGPVGICAEGGLEGQELEEVARADRDRAPERWAETECVSDADCAEGQCQDAACQGGEGPCPEGLTQVDGPGDCLQDDAVCLEVEPGVFCTGPDAPECPEGFEPVESCDGQPEGCFAFSESLNCSPVAQDQNCCCEFIVEGDIIEEDLLPVDQCAAREQGQCIEVDPNRLTPHPCCPDATGERCGDG